MDYETRKQVYEQAIDTFGTEVQLIVAIEELSELQKELSKYLRGFPNPRNLAEEIADCQIMLEQLQLIFHNHDAVSGWTDSKLKRLMRRIDDAIDSY